MEKNPMQSKTSEYSPDKEWKELNTPISVPTPKKGWFKNLFSRKEKAPAVEKVERGIVNPKVDEHWAALDMPLSDVFGSVWERMKNWTKNPSNVGTSEFSAPDKQWAELNELTVGQTVGRAWENVFGKHKEKRQDITSSRKELETAALNMPADVEKAKSGIANIWNKIQHYGNEIYLQARWSVLGGSMTADLVENEWKLKGLKEKMDKGADVKEGAVASTEAKIRDLQERIGSKIATSKEFAQRAQIIPLEPAQNNSIEQQVA